METVDQVLVHLGRSRDETQAALDALAALRARAEESAARLESPNAVLEFIDFFTGFFTEAAATFHRVAGELVTGPSRAHVDALRQIASNAAAEQRRVLRFRDKWINRPLPYEDVRPLLTDISNQARDRLAACRDLGAAADLLDRLAAADAPAPADEGRALGRRELFTKWFGR